MSLYLDGIFNEKYSSPSQVKISIPVWGSTGTTYDILCGLLTSEPTFSSQNKWGPVLTDVSNLTDISHLLMDNEVFSWIAASTQCWKGTDPLRFDLDFYLINYREGLRFEQKLRNLVKLTSLDKSNDKFNKVKVVPHGGYSADLMQSNERFFDNKKFQEKENRKDPEHLKKGRELMAGSDTTGTASVKIGNNKMISNLLVSRVSITPSLVEVIDSRGINPKPLYYQVSVGFTGVKPLLSVDVDKMF